MQFVMKRPNCELICILYAITTSKMKVVCLFQSFFLFLRILLMDATLCSFPYFSHMIHTTALDQRNIFKPRGAGNTAGAAD